MSFQNEIANFNKTISITKIHVIYLPPIIMVFGGPARVDLSPTVSCRNCFLDEAFTKKISYAHELKKPEEYPEWNSFEGYQNLIDFEIDAGSLCRSIIIFLESPGSLAELGAFCTDPELRKILFIVISSKHYNDNSFIKLGPIRKLEAEDNDNVCVVDAIDAEFSKYVSDVLITFEEKLNQGHKREHFNRAKRRDIFLLVADLIDLFGALKLQEILSLFVQLEVEMEMSRLKTIIKQLSLFGLIQEIKETNKTYFVIKPGDKTSYLDYDSVDTSKKFDRINFKLKLRDLRRADTYRQRAYLKVWGGD